ncbi:MAG: hypothetical protein II828_10240 [Clostridia bacterium]|nr:hypothetical protein [Clostridia bacterium]
MEKKKSKSLRKTLLLVTASVLTAAISVGVTLSYLTAKSNTKENTFTPSTSTISGKVKEPKFDADKNYYFSPGDVIPKNPMVENTSSEDSMFVGAKVRFYIDPIGDGSHEVQVSYETFSKFVTVYQGTGGTGSTGFDTNWTSIDSGITDTLAKAFKFSGTSSGVAGEVKSGETTPAIFGSVTPSKNIYIPDSDGAGKTAVTTSNAGTNDQLATIGDNLSSYQFSGFKFRIKVDAFGVAKDAEVGTLSDAENFIKGGLNGIA